MHDPFPLPPPPILQHLTAPLSRLLSLPTLPLHAHEVLLAYALYLTTQLYISPRLSTRLFPAIYPRLAPKTRLNWDVHVVSLLQSTLINGLALWVMWSDGERAGMGQRERVWGYTGAGGMIQGFAAGYFLWDLGVSLWYLDVFGVGLLAHAVSALVVFSLGFRPFVNYYGPTFILYELSSPFLNFHWFFDKLNMTGSRAQLYNGLLLLFTFFGCRLVWGTYQSVRVYQDVWSALQYPGPHNYNNSSYPDHDGSKDAAEMMRFAGDQRIPVWLAVTYLGSNILLNTLNFYWFGKMIEAVRKRFSKKAPGKEEGKEKEVVELVEGVELIDGECISVEERKGEVRRRKA
ncbi:hypothetical protein FGG08_006832 [Glutinoglossum americanum]|uniref:TLC domain-containing protein n=1 Tax=Glutinoglossum americanum TaxID=1670608 RepID=A0A9P8I032_9PEZI|nr:hypothetical protein FGG08_006832 [Glutinoglossum americanum]